MMKAFAFINQAKTNYIEHSSNSVIKEHFTEHLVGCSVGILGGVISFGFSIIHFLAQNIYGASLAMIKQIEYGTDIGGILILASGILFLEHMTREETKGHPYYIQEYGQHEVTE
jgi:hypothetical protein